MYKDKKAFLRTMTPLAKALYKIGAMKVIKGSIRIDKTINYDMKLRAVHPINWIVIPVAIVIYGVNKETLKDAKKMITFI